MVSQTVLHFLLFIIKLQVIVKVIRIVLIFLVLSFQRQRETSVVVLHSWLSGHDVTGLITNVNTI